MADALARDSERVVTLPWPRSEREWAAWARAVGLPEHGRPVPRVTELHAKRVGYRSDWIYGALWWVFDQEGLLSVRFQTPAPTAGVAQDHAEAFEQLRSRLDHVAEPTSHRDMSAGSTSAWRASGVEIVLNRLVDESGFTSWELTYQRGDARERSAPSVGGGD